MSCNILCIPEYIRNINTDSASSRPKCIIRTRNEGNLYFDEKRHDRAQLQWAEKNCICTRLFYTTSVIVW